MIEKMKRLISTLLIMSMVFAVPCFSAFAEEDAAEPTKAEQFMVQMNIVSEEDITDNFISRGAFIDLLMKSMNNAHAYVDSMQPFSDVTAEQAWFTNIGKAYQLGYVSGYTETEFRPFNEIKSEEAVSIMKKALKVDTGDIEIKQFDVITRADDFEEVFDGVKFTDGKLTYRNAVIMMYNMLNVERTVIKNGDVSDEGETLLYNCWGVYEVEGRVTSVPMTSINSENGCGKNAVVIDNTQYIYDKQGANDFLGYYVTAYIKEGNGDGEHSVVAMFEKPSKNNHIRIASTQIKTGCFDGSELTYDNGTSKKKTVKISRTASVIYNGVFAGSQYEKSIFDVPLGYIDLIDNDNDKTYDVVKIESYKTIVSTTDITKAEKMITDFYVPGEILRFEEEGVETVAEFKIDGEYADYTKIAKGDIVNYYETVVDDVRYIKAIVTRDTITGTLERSGKDDFVIEGKTVRKAAQFRNNNVTKGDTPTIGKFGLFRLNFMGEVEVFETQVEQDRPYGILLKVANSDEPDEFIVRIFTTGMEAVSFPVSDKFMIDGTRVKTADAAKTKLLETKFSDYDDNQDLLIQLIRYRLSDGELKEIYTSAGTTVDNPQIGAAFKERQAITSGATTYGSDVREFSVDNQTVCFVLPPLDENDELSPNDIFVYLYSSLPNLNGKKSQAYDLDSFGMADAAVFIHSFKDEDYGDTPPMYLVQSNTLKVDDSGEVIRELELWYAGSRYLKTTYDIDLGEDLQPGDLILVVDDTDSKIRYINKIFTLNPPNVSNYKIPQGIINGDKNNFRAKSRVFSGYITAANSGTALMTYDANKSSTPTVEAFEGFWPIGSTNTMVYEEGADTVSIIASSTLPEYISFNAGNDYLTVIQEQYGVVKSAVIYVLKER